MIGEAWLHAFMRDAWHRRKQKRGFKNTTQEAGNNEPQVRHMRVIGVKRGGQRVREDRRKRVTTITINIHSRC